MYTSPISLYHILCISLWYILYIIITPWGWIYLRYLPGISAWLDFDGTCKPILQSHLFQVFSRCFISIPFASVLIAGSIFVTVDNRNGVMQGLLPKIHNVSVYIHTHKHTDTHRHIEHINITAQTLHNFIYVLKMYISVTELNYIYQNLFVDSRHVLSSHKID